MGNKSTSSQSKKSIHYQAYQQEQLNKIEKEIKKQHPQNSFTYHQNNQPLEEDLITFEALEAHSDNRRKLKANPSDLKQGSQIKDLKSKSQQKIENDLERQTFSENQSRETSSIHSNINSVVFFNDRKESSKKEIKKNILHLENNLSNLIRNENYFAALDKLFEILFLNKKIYGNNSEQVAFTMHRMSSILCLLGRLEEALKYEYESCQIRKSILGTLDINIAKSLIYISKLLWYFKKYVQSFYYILEAYNISEHPINRLQMELKQMIGEVSLEMSNIAHENEHFILSFKLKILAFQSKRAAFLFDESYIDDDLTLLAHEVWNYKQGIFLLQMIPSKKYQISLSKQNSTQIDCCDSNGQEDNCPICYIEFKEQDEQKELLCNHIFHSVCIDRWIIKNQKCPMCRKSQDLEEYLSFQQSRLHKIQQEQNQNIQQKFQNLMIENTEFNFTGEKESKNKDEQKNQANLEQTLNRELIQLSPRTQQTFIFLKKEMESKEIDIFMQDYNQHFNILPLPSETVNPDQNIKNSKDESKDQSESNVQTNNSQQSSEDNSNKNSATDAEMEKNSVLKEVINNINFNKNQQKICENQIKESLNLPQNILFEKNPDEEYDFLTDENLFNCKNQLNFNENQDDNQDEQEEEQKYQNDDQNQFQFYQNAHSSQQRIQFNKNKNYSERVFGVSAELIQEHLNCMIQVGQLFSDESEIQPFEHQRGVQNNQKHLFGQYEGIMAQSSDFNNLEEIEDVNYEDSSEESLEDEFEQNINQQQENSFSQFEFQKACFDDNNEQINQQDMKKQEQNGQNELFSFGQQDIDFDQHESIFTDQSFQNISSQFQIKESVNSNKIQNRFVYFEESRKEDEQIQKQPNKNLNEEVQLKQFSSYKTIDDTDVNFDEDRISEISNKGINFSDNRYNNYLSNNQQQANNNNFVQNIKHESNQNGSVKQNHNNLVINQNNLQSRDKLIINTIPVNNIKQNIISNARSYYQNDEFDIFDKKSVTKFSQNQKINLFEDDQKENQFMYDNNYVINNNKYSQMSFL
ncbi:zinc finger, C3HC4 type (RING finger) protein (macronuclear) [Tetrahymena thermophila SB210]|uniref:Zinc finger, C3HC4 type (RING finger) protein n=1 Tax=Tetrahymena thermophila (strain SB210) TaxID=312017 RepID=I7MDH6_TETTS|nr:zinc finger, C3HC4 type (RING finger) protein [Tetrahymena thermophila SB210]EAR87604.1 zinc finger, C3HC4 type (RING finger) protein [Tetrahymena thermophila SB210]|eukprot:XP_001007849.1 zinc finger, C3HC4 type (RING finger) protein [Tetrahymena thermophila SB210]